MKVLYTLAVMFGVVGLFWLLQPTGELRPVTVDEVSTQPVARNIGPIPSSAQEVTGERVIQRAHQLIAAHPTDQLSKLHNLIKKDVVLLSVGAIQPFLFAHYLVVVQGSGGPVIQHTLIVDPAILDPQREEEAQHQLFHETILFEQAATWPQEYLAWRAGIMRPSQENVRPFCARFIQDQVTAARTLDAWLRSQRQAPSPSEPTDNDLRLATKRALVEAGATPDLNETMRALIPWDCLPLWRQELAQQP